METYYSLDESHHEPEEIDVRLFCARQYAFRPTSLEQRLTLVYRNPRFKLVPKSKTNCRTAHVGMNVCLCHPRLIAVEFAASAGCTSDGGRVRDRFTEPSKFAPVTASYDLDVVYAS